ncbi:hypothetical protein [Rhodovulum visakhapatnamense]|uniref:Class I SAM-dependent methyltransferase n=1 Tax=Rhodovulum visakhapatnamense TaxID=364297 RepID=A0ABS1RL68_9RHOB|nr:hypothetical protein [Rhodovulum visakhapatnamense]MBL3571839.1 hypothetical protein [Rhodovulum visakhapatnamense]MBL3580383.1 hypothetical protein [Rhodovulum visakhapatnamense]
MTDSARWLNRNFAGWSNLTAQEKRAIRDFPVLWSIFELRATGRNGQRPDASPERICQAVDDLEVEPTSEVFQRAKIYFSSRYFHAGNPTVAYSHLQVNDAFQGRVRDALLDAGAGTGVVLIGLLLVVNRLRKNFLHGGKAAYAFADQLDNFRHANAVLMSAIPLWD